MLKFLPPLQPFLLFAVDSSQSWGLSLIHDPTVGRGVKPLLFYVELPIEVKFLDVIGTKVLKVFLLFIHSYLYSINGFYSPPP
jgi:hypothetical protein